MRAELERHEGGDLGLRVGEVVGAGALAGGLAEGVEVRFPPVRVPDLEVLFPVAVVDGAGVRRVPGLPEGVGGAFFVGGGAEEFGGLRGGVVEDLDGEAVDDGDGAGGGGWGCVVGEDGEGGAGGGDGVEGA